MRAVFIGLLFLFSQNISATETLNFGFSDKLVLPKFEKAREYLSIWLNKMGKNKNVKFQLQFYKNKDEILEKYLKGEIVFTVFDFKYFYKNFNSLKKNTHSYYVVDSENRKGSKYCLIARKDSKIDNLKKIKNKKLQVYEADEVGNIWLDKKSLQTNHKSFKNLISNTKYISKESTILLNVFFKKTDLGVIRKNIWDIMAELNPTISKNVKIITCSKESFIPTIAILSNRIDKKRIGKVLTLLNNFNSFSEGEQIFNLFDISNVADIKKSQILKMQKFYNEYIILKKKYMR